MVSFKKGGHYCFKKHADLVNDEIGKLLQKICSDQSAYVIRNQVGDQKGTHSEHHWSDAEYEDEQKQRIQIRAKN